MDKDITKEVKETKGVRPKSLDCSEDFNSNNVGEIKQPEKDWSDGCAHL